MTQNIEIAELDLRYEGFRMKNPALERKLLGVIQQDGLGEAKGRMSECPDYKTTVRGAVLFGALPLAGGLLVMIPLAWRGLRLAPESATP